MREYIVSIEKNGDQIIVGSIIGTDVSDASFVYDDKYLNSDDPVAISISLPLQKEPFSSKQTSVLTRSQLIKTAPHLKERGIAI